MPNTAPTLTIIGQTNFNEQFEEKLFLAGTSLSDPELDALNGGNGNYSGATLTIQRTGTANSDDTFGFIFTAADFVFLNGSDVAFFNGSDYVNFGTFESVGGVLTITFDTFSAIPTTELVNAFLRGISYTHNSDTPPPITATPAIELTITFSDGGPESQTSSTAIGLDVQANNDEPQSSGGDIAIYLKGETIALTAAHFGVTDPDSPPEEIHFSVSAGNLTTYLLDGVQTNSFTMADVLAGKISATPPSNSDFDVVNSALQTGNTQGTEIVGVTIKFLPLLPAPTLDAADDTGIIGDNITAQSFGLTFNGTMTGLDFQSSLALQLILAPDGIDNDNDGSIDEEFEGENIAFFQSFGGDDYSFTVNLGAGTHVLRAVAFEPFTGNIIPTSTFEITIDPDTTGPDLAAADDTGSSNTDNLTNQNTGLTFSGTASGSGQTVELFRLDTPDPDGIDNDSDGEVDEPDESVPTLTSLGTTTTGAGGAWSIDIDFAPGQHNLQIVASVDGGPITPATQLQIDQQVLPLNATVTADGNIAIEFNGQTMANATLELADFSVLVDGVAVVPTSITFNDPATRTGLLLTFSQPIESWQTVTLDYDATAGVNNTIADMAGNATPTTSIPANNVSQFDTKAPTLLKAEVASGLIMLTFDEAVQGGEAEDFTVTINGQTYAIDSVASGYSSNDVSSSGIDPQRVLILFPTDALPVVVSGSVAYSSTAGAADSVTDLASLPAGANAAVSQDIAMSLNNSVQFVEGTQTVTQSEDSLPAVATTLNAIMGASEATDLDVFQTHTVSSQLVSATFTDVLGATQAVTVNFNFLTGVSESLTAVSATWALVGASSTSLKYLGTGEVLSVIYSVTVDDRSGSTDTQQVTFNFTGQNEVVNGTIDDESLTGSNFADDISSFAGDDTVKGLGGHDNINTSTGDDSVDAGSGNDIVNGGTGDDYLIGGSGNDEVYGGLEADRIYGGSGNDLLVGNEGSDDLFGGSGDDTLIGGLGFDSLRGGEGNDTYVLDLNDSISEFSDSGIDTVRAAITHTLTSNVENLVQTGTANINGTGNALANTITGNAGVNTLNGAGGNDILISGTGADVLIGGSAADQFQFNAVSASRSANGIDTIQDFDFAEGDRIDLHLLDANISLDGDQSFTTQIASGAAFTAAGQYRLSAISGGFRLELNLNSNNAADMAIDILTTSNVAGAADWLIG